ncbi:MAG TPA: glycine dehydrogenase subunit 2 [Ignisphaera sp.]|nr:glycine dehydrogenase subunit 2 [Ignisphaera sp.]
MEWRQAKWDEKLIFEYPSLKQSHIVIPFDEEFAHYKEKFLDKVMKRGIMRLNVDIPNLSEPIVVRHFVRLSQQSYGVDVGPVPLGSCTMKYNPKVCNEALRVLDIEEVHPEELDEYVQGLLEILYLLERWLAEITGMDKCSFQPPAGAAGEFAGALMIKKFHEDRGEHRDEMLIPDSAHGSNPASAAMAGFKIIKIPTSQYGTLDLEALKSVVSERTAGLMLTNPNTLGVFEDKILEIADIVHSAGGLLYYDGANLNGIIGIARPGDMGFDIVHLNLHKTFGAPHGGGGPGGGVVCAKGALVEYLPRPLIAFDGTKYYWDYECRRCIGIIRAYYGNIPALIRAFVYIAMLGPEGLREVAEVSVLNTNYFIKKLSKHQSVVGLTHDTFRPRKHETVLSASRLKKDTGVSAEDVSKRMLDYGIHAPMMYFPLIVDEALMIEFTECEPKFEIDRYVEVLSKTVTEAYRDSNKLKCAPMNTAISRLDLVRANHPKKLILSWKFKNEIKELQNELKHS